MQMQVLLLYLTPVHDVYFSDINKLLAVPVF